MANVDYTSRTRHVILHIIEPALVDYLKDAYSQLENQGLEPSLEELNVDTGRRFFPGSPGEQVRAYLNESAFGQRCYVLRTLLSRYGEQLGLCLDDQARGDLFDDFQALVKLRNQYGDMHYNAAKPSVPLTREQFQNHCHLAAKCFKALGCFPQAEQLEQAASAGVAHNVDPWSGQPFVGRQSELALLSEDLASEGRCALLYSGVGGLGKSALLRRALLDYAEANEESLTPRYNVIVWCNFKTDALTISGGVSGGIRELDGYLHTRRDLLQEIARIGYGDSDSLAAMDDDALEQKLLYDLFPHNRVLLVVDNAETLVTAPPDSPLQDALRCLKRLNSKNLTGGLLGTSRDEQLILPWEGRKLEPLKAEDAVRLFREGRERYRPNAEMPEEDMVRRIVEQLHYNPLLILWTVSQDGDLEAIVEAACSPGSSTMQFLFQKIQSNLSESAKKVLGWAAEAGGSISKLRLEQHMLLSLWQEQNNHPGVDDSDTRTQGDEARELTLDALAELESKSMLTASYTREGAVYNINPEAVRCAQDLNRGRSNQERREYKRIIDQFDQTCAFLKDLGLPADAKIDDEYQIQIVYALNAWTRFDAAYHGKPLVRGGELRDPGVRSVAYLHKSLAFQRKKGMYDAAQTQSDLEQAVEVMRAAYVMLSDFVRAGGEDNVHIKVCIVLVKMQTLLEGMAHWEEQESWQANLLDDLWRTSWSDVLKRKFLDPSREDAFVAYSFLGYQEKYAMRHNELAHCLDSQDPHFVWARDKDYMDRPLDSAIDKLTRAVELGGDRAFNAQISLLTCKDRRIQAIADPAEQETAFLGLLAEARALDARLEKQRDQEEARLRVGQEMVSLLCDLVYLQKRLCRYNPDQAKTLTYARDALSEAQRLYRLWQVHGRRDDYFTPGACCRILVRLSRTITYPESGEALLCQAVMILDWVIEKYLEIIHSGEYESPDIQVLDDEEEDDEEDSGVHVRNTLNFRYLPEAFQNRGKAYLHLGDNAAAIRDYQRAVTTQKRYPVNDDKLEATLNNLAVKLGYRPERRKGVLLWVETSSQIPPAHTVFFYDLEDSRVVGAHCGRFQAEINAAVTEWDRANPGIAAAGGQKANPKHYRRILHDRENWSIRHAMEMLREEIQDGEAPRRVFTYYAYLSFQEEDAYSAIDPYPLTSPDGGSVLWTPDDKYRSYWHQFKRDRSPRSPLPRGGFPLSGKQHQIGTVCSIGYARDADSYGVLQCGDETYRFLCRDLPDGMEPGRDLITDDLVGFDVFQLYDEGSQVEARNLRPMSPGERVPNPVQALPPLATGAVGCIVSVLQDRVFLRTEEFGTCSDDFRRMVTELHAKWPPHRGEIHLSSLQYGGLQSTDLRAGARLRYDILPGQRPDCFEARNVLAVHAPAIIPGGLLARNAVGQILSIRTDKACAFLRTEDFGSCDDETRTHLERKRRAAMAANGGEVYLPSYLFNALQSSLCVGAQLRYDIQSSKKRPGNLEAANASLLTEAPAPVQSPVQAPVPTPVPPPAADHIAPDQTIRARAATGSIKFLDSRGFGYIIPDPGVRPEGMDADADFYLYHKEVDPALWQSLQPGDRVVCDVFYNPQKRSFNACNVRRA